MKRTLIVSAVFLSILSTTVFAGSNKLGLGINYWSADNEPASYDSSGFSYFGTYRYKPGFWGLEANLEYYPSDSIYKHCDAVWEPQALFTIGSLIYGSAGVGWPFGDSEIRNKPAGYLKAGVNFPIFPAVKLDVSGKYKYQRLKDFEHGDKDTVNSFVFGAALNIEF